jgi:hypothetical protein
MAEGGGNEGRWRAVADWASRAVFIASLVIGWIALGPPWSPKEKGSAGVLGSAVVPIGAFIVAALVQRVIVADYAVKAGPIELASLQRAAATLDDQHRIIETYKAELGHVKAQRNAALAVVEELVGRQEP